MGNGQDIIPNNMFGNYANYVKSKSFVGGKECPILVIKNEVEEQQGSSTIENYTTLTITHMNASSYYLNTATKIGGEGIGFEIPVGALINYVDVYAGIVMSLNNVNVKTTFILTFTDGDIEVGSSDVFKQVVTNLVLLGAEFAIDKIETADDFLKLDGLFDIIHKVRLTGPVDIELVSHLSSRRINAIQDGE